VDSIRDLCNVIAQISGTLVSKLDNPTGWNLPYFYVPSEERAHLNKDKKFIQALEVEENMIHSLCDDFDDGVESKVVNNLLALRDDARRIKEKTEMALAAMTGSNSDITVLRVKKVVAGTVLWVFMVPFVLSLIALQFEEKLPQSLLEQSQFKALNDMIPNPFPWERFAVIFAICLGLLFFAYRYTVQISKKIAGAKEGQAKLCTAEVDAKVLKENIERLDTILKEREKLNKAWLHDNLHDDSEMINSTVKK